MGMVTLVGAPPTFWFGVPRTQISYATAPALRKRLWTGDTGTCCDIDAGYVPCVLVALVLWLCLWLWLRPRLTDATSVARDSRPYALNHGDTVCAPLSGGRGGSIRFSCGFVLCPFHQSQMFNVNTAMPAGDSADTHRLVWEMGNAEVWRHRSFGEKGLGTTWCTQGLPPRQLPNGETMASEFPTRTALRRRGP